MKRPVRRAALGALAVLAAAGSSAHAQFVRGQVKDELNHNPLKQVSIQLLDARDSVIRSTNGNDSGRYSMRIPGPGRYSLDFHRVGYVRTTTTPFAIAAGDTFNLNIEMPSNGVTLDTVTTKAALEPKHLFQVTPGVESLREHYVLGKGVQVGWYTIEKSKLSLSGYLGTVEGLHLNGTYAQGTPVIPAEHGQFLMADGGAQCLYGRVDRYSLLYMLMQDAAETIDDLLKMKDIMAVEVYRNHQEIPPEWGQFGIVDELFTRRNSGHTYTIGHTGFPAIPVQSAAQSAMGSSLAAGGMTIGSILSEDAMIYGTAAVDPSSSAGHVPACGFLQIWTGAAYYSTGGVPPAHR